MARSRWNLFKHFEPCWIQGQGCDAALLEGEGCQSTDRGTCSEFRRIEARGSDRGHQVVRFRCSNRFRSQSMYSGSSRSHPRADSLSPIRSSTSSKSITRLQHLSTPRKQSTSSSLPKPPTISLSPCKSRDDTASSTSSPSTVSFTFTTSKLELVST